MGTTTLPHAISVFLGKVKERYAAIRAQRH
jgi:hypothetical protein